MRLARLNPVQWFARFAFALFCSEWIAFFDRFWGWAVCDILEFGSLICAVFAAFCSSDL